MSDDNTAKKDFGSSVQPQAQQPVPATPRVEFTEAEKRRIQLDALRAVRKAGNEI